MIMEDLFEREDSRWTAFICTCSLEGIIEAGKLKQEVRRLLSEGSSELLPRPCKVSNFLTMVVTSLEWDFDHSSIKAIYTDQWSMISAEGAKGFEYGDFSVLVRCDEVEDGIAAVWYAFWLRKQEKDEGEAPQ